MTAEIAVMNKYGVALAADSAVTVTFLERGQSRQKIFSTNKLFMLSKQYPVGIMIFGNASLLGVPWEILIKEYRKRELLGKSFPTLDEYGADFINYLSGNTFYFNQNLQLEAVYYIFSKHKEIIANQFKSTLLNHIRSGQIKDDAELKKFTNAILEDTVNEKYEDLLKLDDIKTFQITETRFNKLYGQIVDESINDFPNALPQGATISAKVKNRLKKIAHLAVVKNTFEINEASGVVIAGYGEAEIYPSLVAYDIEAVVDDKLKYITARDISVSHQENAFVEPFAQDDMVQTFMRGVSPRYEQYNEGFVQKVLDEYPDKVIAKLDGILDDAQKKILSDAQKKALAEQLKGVGKDILKNFQSAIYDRVSGSSEQAVKRAVSMLPIDELASMASSLVNLTSFKRRVTPVSETVGGAVDVAVITKGDGFVWIERKHYFEAGKNPHFFANNYGGIDYERQQGKGDEKNGSN